MNRINASDGKHQNGTGSWAPVGPNPGERNDLQVQTSNNKLYGFYDNKKMCWHSHKLVSLVRCVQNRDNCIEQESSQLSTLTEPEPTNIQ